MVQDDPMVQDDLILMASMRDMHTHVDHLIHYNLIVSSIYTVEPQPSPQPSLERTFLSHTNESTSL